MKIFAEKKKSFFRLIELNKRIDAFTAIEKNLTPLSNVALAENCLAKIMILDETKFKRAKIMKIFQDPLHIDGTTAEVFFVDLGEFIVLPARDLIEIPKTYITALPFQVS